MKLTQQIRDAFIRGVMADVPQVDYSGQAKEIFLQAFVDQLPKEIRALYDNPKLKAYVNVCYQYEAPIPTEYHFARCSGFPCRLGELAVEVAKARIAVMEKILPLSEKEKEQSRVREDLVRTLTAVAMSCTTTKALANTLPEFAKYLPSEFEKAKHTLVVIQDVSKKFKEAGWPAGKKSAKASNDIAGAINLAVQAA